MYLETVLHNKRSHPNKKPGHPNWRAEPCSLQLEKAHMQQERPSAAKWINNYLKKKSWLKSTKIISWPAAWNTLLNHDSADFLTIQMSFQSKHMARPFTRPCLHFFPFLAVSGLNLDMPAPVPWAGVKARPLALGVQSLSHWTTREVRFCIFKRPSCWFLAGKHFRDYFSSLSLLFQCL